ncbi:MAG: Sapep family Mn(2+)-dependent dipeptidase [Bacillota bacterium]|nr:Sapep family Mn(2+)-dependent dipeptidase [Bacillota bacterium]
MGKKTEKKKFSEEMKQQMIRNLCDFVAIESVSSDSEKIREAMDFILDLAADMGLRSQRLLDGQIGIVEIGRGGETLGILAHLDVVPAGDRTLWETEPFRGTIRNGRVYGRGTLDDKGMIVAALYAMKQVQDSGIPLKKTVRLIIGTQEEVAWTDMGDYVERYTLPDYGFSPDGEYPICNIEKGVLDVLLEFPMEGPVSGIHPEESGLTDAEPAVVSSVLPAIAEIHAGESSNTVPGRAVAYLDTGEEVVATGKAVHSCQPERGENAIFALADKAESMELSHGKAYELLLWVRDAFLDMTGTALGLASETEYYQGEYVHRNIFCPTVLSVEKGLARLNVNVRFPYGEDPQRLADGLERCSKELGGRILSCESLPAVFVSRKRPFLKAFAEAYEEVTGLTNEFALAYGGSYAKAMPNIVSWGPIFPGEEDTCHEPNEYLAIESFVKNAEIFTRTIEKIALSEQSFK